MNPKRKHSPGTPPWNADDLRLTPQRRLCSKFDGESLAKFPAADASDMGVSVIDNCAEEHIM